MWWCHPTRTTCMFLYSALQHRPSTEALPPAEQKQNPKSKIQNPRARRPSGTRNFVRDLRILDSGFWILDSGFWILPSVRLGSDDETGDEAEDPNDSLRIRAPFTALRQEQNPKRVARPPDFAARFSAPSGNLGKIQRPKSQNHEAAESQRASNSASRVWPSKSSWTNFDFPKVGR